VGPVAPATIFIAFGGRNAIMNTGHEIPTYDPAEVTAAGSLNFEVT